VYVCPHTAHTIINTNTAIIIVTTTTITITRYALFLEDEERFPESEEEFVKADKPKEAIDMYIHQQDWRNAVRVAETYDPASVPEVLVAQAKASSEAGNHKVTYASLMLSS
jgi:intraflagellar transport protein 172